MTCLELLAPAKNIEIGIAAIDCGADAVYIAGPAFGARQAAGNSMEDLERLCTYAHKFGARIFMTLNTIVYDEELDDAYSLMCRAEDAGVDAIIVQDLAVLRMADGGPEGAGRKIRIPLHASTQCAIRSKDKALFYKSLGFSRLVLERELPLPEIREISSATDSEIEFFVHGALCVCYSGQCYMSEAIADRSANRGECIQACRSLYNLTDASGKILVRNKALLSLKDYNLLKRLGDLADAGVTSFKIEGRLKNISYVRNTVLAYSRALDELVSRHPDRYRRASSGIVTGGFTPDLSKTFNRGYTELFIDGRRGLWASMDTPKGMGEAIGTVRSIRPAGKDGIEVNIRSAIRLCNGDGFAFTGKSGEIIGFRGDVCSGTTIRCRKVEGLSVGALLYRNISAEFEKILATRLCRRLIPVDVNVSVSGDASGGYVFSAKATSMDGRSVSVNADGGHDAAENSARMKSMIVSQIGKISGDYSFFSGERFLDIATADGSVPFVSAAFLNGIRRSLAEELGRIPALASPLMNVREEDNREINDKFFLSFSPTGTVNYKFNAANRIARGVYSECGAISVDGAYEIEHQADAELMRTKYCIRYELGLCPRHKGSGHKGIDLGHMKIDYPLMLENNGRRFVLGFDCGRCEMTVKKKMDSTVQD